MADLRVGEPAPDFSLPDQTGIVHRLSDARGKWVLVYFYPKDETPGCTAEACGIRDQWAEFRSRGVVVFGVSIDTVESHQRFVQKYTLPFALLADPRKEVVQTYGVYGPKVSFGQRLLGTRRSSFLVAPDGTIAKMYPKVVPETHAAEVLQDLAELQKVSG